jgi:ketosteroid isomerase-like protein
MPISPAFAVALAFNEAIIRRDADALAVLMTDDHTFVDSANKVVASKPERLPHQDRTDPAWSDCAVDDEDVVHTARHTVRVTRAPVL